MIEYQKNYWKQNSFEGRISESSLKNLKEIEEYFTQDNLLGKIRNQYGFHYYQKNLESYYKKIPEDEKMSFYEGDSMLDFFYDFSDWFFCCFIDYTSKCDNYPGENEPVNCFFEVR